MPFYWSKNFLARADVLLANLLICLSVSLPVRAQTVDQLIPHHVSLKQISYRGRPAVQVMADPDSANGSSYAILQGSSFQDGTVEVDMAAKPAAGAGPEARGFVGIAFRMRDDSYEYIYIRPTNGRADDQVRRNHSTQYGSYPDFDFARLRRESPEKYESYVDLQPGEWTKFRIEIEGRKARLYINAVEQPVLVVNDLKLTPQAGAIALWVGPGTEGYFSGLSIRPNASHALASGAAGTTQIYFDTAHGEARWPSQMEEIGGRLNYRLEQGTGKITPAALKESRLVYLRAPNQAFQGSEKQAVIAFVKAGGSLLVVLDEEQRQKLAVVGVNDIIAPFGLKLSGDTPHIVNTGAMAKPGEINKGDRELPYDGGRQVFGGTPFAYQLDRDGKAAQPYAAYAKVNGGGRVVVMAEGMASLFLGVPDAVRLTVNPDHPKWWGKDAPVFMEEVLVWLLAQ